MRLSIFLIFIFANGCFTPGEPNRPYLKEKELVIQKNAEKLDRWKKEEHKETGISNYYISLAYVNSGLGYPQTTNKIKNCYISYIQKTPSEELKDKNPYLPKNWFFENDTPVSYVLVFVTTKLGLSKIEMPGEYDSIIAVGPYKPTGYMQDGFLTEELVDQYASNDYLFYQKEKGADRPAELHVAHVPSIEKLFELNGREKYLKLFGINEPYEIVKHLAESRFDVKRSDDEKAMIYALFGDVYMESISKLTLTQELLEFKNKFEKLKNDNPENDNPDIRVMAYNLEKGNQNLLTPIKPLADDFVCRF